MATTRLSTKQELRDAYRGVADRIAAAADRTGRRGQDIVVVAVTTHATPDQIRQIVELGQTDLADEDVGHLQQRVVQLEEFLGRRRFLMRGETGRGGDRTPDAVRWHMIGPMPRGSAKTVLPVVRLVQSVDSLRLAEDLHAYGARMEGKLDGPIDILLQVNPTDDDKHPGIAAPAVVHMAEQIDTMVHLSLRGLMVNTPDDDAEAQQAIGRVADLYVEMRKDLPPNTPLNIFSVVTDEHYEAAVEAGANMVCLATPLFGDVTG